MVNLWLEESDGLSQWASNFAFESYFLQLAQKHCPTILNSENNTL